MSGITVRVKAIMTSSSEWFVSSPWNM